MNSADYYVRRNIPVAMRDGVTLATDLWLPASGEPAPAVLIRTPYDKSRLASDFVRPQQLAEAGYAVAVQDTRGRFASQGRWIPLAWDQEGKDGFDTIEWIADQPWSDGAVGMAGTSYCGIVQLAAAALRPPHLRAIAPTMTGIGAAEQRETNGGFWLDHLFGWLCAVGIDWAREQGDMAAVQTFARWLNDPAELHRSFPVETAPLFAIPGFPVDFARIANGPVTIPADPAELNIPILSVGGWFDMYLLSTIEIGDRSRAAGERNLVIGPWAHGNQPGTMQGEFHFGLASSAAASNMGAQHIAFFDRHLRGRDAALAPVSYFAMPGGGWKTAQSWPPPTTTRTLHPAGEALADAPADGPVTLDYHFDDPAGTVGGRLMPINRFTPGPVDQRVLDGHHDIRRFTTPPLGAALEVAGAPVLSGQLRCDRPSCDIAAKLIDVAPDGRATLVTDAMWRMPRDEAGADRSMTLELADVAWTFAPGHCIRLQLQTSNFPHFDRNPDAGDQAHVELRDLSFELPCT